MEVGARGGGTHLAPAGPALGGVWAAASGCGGGAVRLQGCGGPSRGRSGLAWASGDTPECRACARRCLSHVLLSVQPGPGSRLSPWMVTRVLNHGCRFRGRGRWGARPAHPAAFEGAGSTECRLCLRSVAHSSPVAREAGRGPGSVARPGVVSKDRLAARPLPAGKEQDLLSWAQRTVAKATRPAWGLDTEEAVGVWGGVEKGRWPAGPRGVLRLRCRPGVGVGWGGAGASSSPQRPGLRRAHPAALRDQEGPGSEPAQHLPELEGSLLFGGASQRRPLARAGLGCSRHGLPPHRWPLPAAAVHPVSAAADPLVQEVTDVGLCPIGGLGLGHPATSLRFGALSGDSGWWRHLPLGGPSED